MMKNCQRSQKEGASASYDRTVRACRLASVGRVGRLVYVVLHTSVLERLILFCCLGGRVALTTHFGIDTIDTINVLHCTMRMCVHLCT